MKKSSGLPMPIGLSSAEKKLLTKQRKDNRDRREDTKKIAAYVANENKRDIFQKFRLKNKSCQEVIADTESLMTCRELLDCFVLLRERIAIERNSILKTHDAIVDIKSLEQQLSVNTKRLIIFIDRFFLSMGHSDLLKEWNFLVCSEINFSAERDVIGPSHFYNGRDLMYSVMQSNLNNIRQCESDIKLQYIQHFMFSDFIEAFSNLRNKFEYSISKDDENNISQLHKSQHHSSNDEDANNNNEVIGKISKIVEIYLIQLKNYRFFLIALHLRNVRE